MAQTLQVVKTEDFLRFGTDGAPDLEESRALLTRVARECTDLGLTRVLFDLRARRGESGLSPRDVYELVNTFHETGFEKNHRLAILHRHRSGERAVLFAMLAKHEGWNVEAFENYEDVLEWFGESQRLECPMAP
jgi:hypothetical protein